MGGLNPKQVLKDFEAAYKQDENHIRAQLHGKVALTGTVGMIVKLMYKIGYIRGREKGAGTPVSEIK